MCSLTLSFSPRVCVCYWIQLNDIEDEIAQLMANISQINNVESTSAVMNQRIMSLRFKRCLLISKGLEAKRLFQPNINLLNGRKLYFPSIGIGISIFLSIIIICEAFETAAHGECRVRACVRAYVWMCAVRIISSELCQTKQMAVYCYFR